MGRAQLEPRDDLGYVRAMLVTGLILCGCALAAFAVVVHVVLTHRRLRLRGVRRVGRAAAVADPTDNTESLLVTFTDESGGLHTVQSQGSTAGWARHDGEAAVVLYPPGRPERARIERDLVFQRRLGLLIGAVLLVVGVVLVVVGRT